MKNIKIFSHTADIGIEVRSKSLAGIFNNAGRAVIGLAIRKSRGSCVRRHIRLKAASLEELLHDFLNEILYYIFVKKCYLKSAVVEKINEAKNRLEAAIYVDPQKTAGDYIKEELKSVTYHNLVIQKNLKVYKTRIVIDA